MDTITRLQWTRSPVDEKTSHVPDGSCLTLTTGVDKSTEPGFNSFSRHMEKVWFPVQFLESTLGIGRAQFA